MIKSSPPFFVMNAKAHRMAPGAVSFIPGWIMLFITILTLALFFPSLFPPQMSQSQLINTYLLVFIIGSLMPAFDDLFAFLFGPPFAHHSLFHSLFGSTLTYFFFLILGGSEIAKYAVFGNLYHIFFNFYLDYVTLFFPLTYREFGLTDIVKVSTYWIKASHYPIILLLFAIAIFTFFAVKTP